MDGARCPAAAPSVRGARAQRCAARRGAPAPPAARPRPTPAGLEPPSAPRRRRRRRLPPAAGLGRGRLQPAAAQLRAVELRAQRRRRRRLLALLLWRPQRAGPHVGAGARRAGTRGARDAALRVARLLDPADHERRVGGHPAVQRRVHVPGARGHAPPAATVGRAARQRAPRPCAAAACRRSWERQRAALCRAASAVLAPSTQLTPYKTPSHPHSPADRPQSLPVPYPGRHPRGLPIHLLVSAPHPPHHPATPRPARAAPRHTHEPCRCGDAPSLPACAAPPTSPHPPAPRAPAPPLRPARRAGRSGTSAWRCACRSTWTGPTWPRSRSRRWVAGSCPGRVGGGGASRRGVVGAGGS